MKTLILIFKWVYVKFSKKDGQSIGWLLIFLLILSLLITVTTEKVQRELIEKKKHNKADRARFLKSILFFLLFYSHSFAQIDKDIGQQSIHISNVFVHRYV